MIIFNAEVLRSADVTRTTHQQHKKNNFNLWEISAANKGTFLLLENTRQDRQRKAEKDVLAKLM